LGAAGAALLNFYRTAVAWSASYLSIPVIGRTAWVSPLLFVPASDASSGLRIKASRACFFAGIFDQLVTFLILSSADPDLSPTSYIG